jgi:hypothetical protein
LEIRHLSGGFNKNSYKGKVEMNDNKYAKRMKKAEKTLDKLTFDERLALLDVIIMEAGTELVTEILTEHFLMEREIEEEGLY